MKSNQVIKEVCSVSPRSGTRKMSAVTMGVIQSARSRP